MPAWISISDWMRWPHLSDGAGLSGAFTLAYKITDDDGTEPWTARFVRFKQKDRVALVGAIGVMRVAVPELIAALGLNGKDVAFVPAPSSSEAKASANSHVATLARLCADAAGARFVLEAVSKQPHRPIHTCGGIAGRDAELAKAAYKGTRLGCGTAIVFDDFITRGGTMSRIAQALIAENPGLRVYGIALGKTERRAYWGVLDNNSVPKKWSALWDSSEESYRRRQAGK